MPLVFTLEAGEEIDVLGVTLRATRTCKLGLDDQDYRFIPKKNGSPRKIVKANESAA